MLELRKQIRRLRLLGLTAALALPGWSSQAQTTPGVTVEILGLDAASLLGGDLTDPENDGLDEAGASTDPSWNWKSINSSHEPDFEGSESSFNIFDNKVGGGADKWCCDDPTVDIPVWVAVEFKQPVSLTHFTVTSGNDSPDRDPTDWAIQGSADGTTYTDIYRFTDTTVPWDARNQVVKFTLPAPSAPYPFIRYIAFETPGTLHQLNEVEYFGILGGVEQLDTDKDGMPDSFEISMGFNPADPTDAVKDFDGDGVSNLDEYKAGTNPIDTTKPTIVAASTTGTYNSIQITFSEDLDAVTAAVATNYTISPALAVTSAVYSRRVVTLTTAAQTPGATAYTVAVAGVTDTSKNEVAAGTQTTVYSYLSTKTGVLRFAYWTGIDGTLVDNLFADERYPASPTGTGAVYSFNSRDFFPTDSLETYGAIMEGFLTPAESGAYRFFVYSDDASQLYLSTDASEANAQVVAEETGCCNNFTEPDSPRTSEPVTLTAGTRYFVRMVYKEGGGGDYGQVAWRKEGDKTPAGTLLPISGKFLSSAVDVPFPPDGVFLTQSPASAAKNVAPDALVRLVHTDGKSAWTAANVTVKFDGATVSPTFTKDGAQVTIVYDPSGLMASKSAHTVAVTYPDPSGQPTTREWSFEVAEYKGPIKDKVAGREGLLFGTAAQTADKGGRTGATGDYGLDFGKATGSINVLDASFVNPAAATDKLSVSFWQKNVLRAASSFWFNSPSSSEATRGFQAHVPWSDGTIYFDSAGCCGADTQRISQNIDQHGGYTGEPTWWESWHHYAFVKNGAVKEIYIDGQLFLTGAGDPLPTDFTNLILGGGSGINDNRLEGTMDDFAVFGTGLTAAQVTALFSGTAPGAVTGNPGLLAHWDFNDAPAVDVKVMVARSGGNVTITSEPAALPAGWVIQTAPSISGPWTQAAAATPATVPIGAGNAFLRAAKP